MTNATTHPPVLRTIAEVRAWPRQHRRAVVMTMGALHEGHLSLMRSAREIVGPDGDVLVTIFVNPLQFGAGEDFERYPRQLQADLAACGTVGIDAVFAPSGAEMYPTGQPRTRVEPGPAGHGLEADSRPGHFSGMLTVVLKLLAITSPDVALFGEKDYQQLVLIRTMVSDFNLPIEVVGVATDREADGVARSSRNAYLTADERRRATAIPRALAAGRTAAAAGADEAGIVAAAHSALATEEVDYLALRSPDLGPAPQAGEARLLVAVRLGSTRLLDNCAVTVGAA